MAAYDPQARRARPTAAGDSPVDDLLGTPEEPAAEGNGSGTGSAAGSKTASGGEAGRPEPASVGSDGTAQGASGGAQRRPFDLPGVEMTDEGADRLQRMAVLAAVVAFIVILSAWRRRHRH